jgi:hypothetical protein
MIGVVLNDRAYFMLNRATNLHLSAELVTRMHVCPSKQN